MEEKILVIGACGQIGTELTLKLREIYGDLNVTAADIREPSAALGEHGSFVSLNTLHRDAVASLLKNHRFTQVYLLAAVLSAVGEKDPRLAWEVNMQSLLNVLDAAKEGVVQKIFWPSSIAVFGKNTPKLFCPRNSVLQPATAYGSSKVAGEVLCNYYFEKYGVDMRSLRYPGLISHLAAPGGGTTDYAVDIFHAVIEEGRFGCFLRKNTLLPMMYMPDTIRATMELAEAIGNYIPDFSVEYVPDYRQKIADGWPGNIDDAEARSEWGWEPAFDLPKMTRDMLR